MALDTNKGTQHYGISCDVPSDPGLVLTSNSGSKYYGLSSNDFILWGQSTHYTHVSSNKGSNSYFLECNVPSDAGLDLNSNSGTKYYFNSAFNCVSFCD
jgi:hypothetical protein